MDLIALIDQQEVAAGKIRQLHANYKKDGEHRKTINYLEAKITLLKGLYIAYKGTDKSITESDPPLESSHKYFESRIEIGEIYENFIAEMRQRLNVGAPSTPTTEHDKEFTYPEPRAGKQLTIPSKSMPVIATPPIKADTHPKQRSQLMTAFDRMIKQQIIKMRSLDNYINAAQKLLAGEKTEPALQLSLAHMERLMNQIIDLQETICVDASDEEEEELLSLEHRYNLIREQYDEVVIAIQIAIKETKSSVENAYEIRLPTIGIPHFNGEHMRWMAFHDVFEKLVHNNKALSSTHKINYLKTYTGGQAAKLINHLHSVGDNYETAWTILNERYNNRRAIVTRYIHTLMSQVTANAEFASALKSLYDTTNECLHAI